METKTTPRRGAGRTSMVLPLAAALFLLAGGTARAETIRGTFNYYDSADLQLHPIVDAKVEVWRYAPGFLGIWGWGNASTVYTDNSGSINTQLTLVASGEVIALRVFATNHAAVVWPESTIHTAPFYREPGEPDGQPIHRTAYSNSDVLPFSYDFAETWSAQHYNIAEALRRAALYANAYLPTPLPLVNAQPTTITPNDSSFYNPVNDTVTINTVSSFDDYVMIHEYGHFIEEQIGSLPWTPSTHSLCMYTDPGLAWMEGFSDYFGMAVRRTSLGNGLAGPFFGYMDYVIESGTACSSGDPHDSIEYFIAATLYDLADAPTDRNSTAETHDLVQGMDGVILAIIDQMDAFGSVPTIWDFRNAWIGRGLNRNDLDRILVKHGMLAPFRDSAFVSQSVPSTLVAGRTGSASVTFRNTGSTTWTPADLYRLGAQNPQDNFTWGLNRVGLPAGAVYPGQQVTFSFTFTAPATPGQYPFVWQMVQDGVTWFGPKTPESQTISVTAGVQQAVLVSQSVPSPLEAGQSFTATLTFQNTGETTWTAANGYVLASRNSPSNLWGPTSVALPASVAPGQTVTFTINGTAPPEGGTYAFQWQMQQNGIAAFGDTSLAWVQVNEPPLTCDSASCAAECTSSGCAGGSCTAYGFCRCVKCY